MTPAERSLALAAARNDSESRRSAAGSEARRTELWVETSVDVTARLTEVRCVRASHFVLVNSVCV